MPVFYLDTSAINSLHDSADSEHLSGVIRCQPVVVYPSVFTVAELGAVSDEQRRFSLLKLEKLISGDYRPLAMPTELLRRSIEAVSVWAADMDNSMGPEWDGVWLALNDPRLITGEAYEEIVQWKRQQEEWFQGMHDGSRPALQEALNRHSPSDKSSFTSGFGKMIRFYPPDSDFVKGFALDLTTRAGADVQVDGFLVERIIKHSEHWRFFLASMAYGFYVRSVKPTHFSRKKNPGSIDTQQAIYLAACDVFVTADAPQRRMLRFLARFGHKKRQVWTYGDLEVFLKSFLPSC
jgi:hypothetical protein